MKTLLFLALFLFSSIAFSYPTLNQNQVPTWNYATPVASPITTTGAVTLATPGANGRAYLTEIQIYNTSATVSTVVTIQAGSTVLWTGYVPATTAALPIVPIHLTLNSPIKGALNTPLTFVANTTGANIFVSAQGYFGL